MLQQPPALPRVPRCRFRAFRRPLSRPLMGPLLAATLVLSGPSLGTAAAQTTVFDIWPGSSGSAPNNLVDVNGILFFSAGDDTAGVELWRADSTGTSVTRLTDAPGWMAPYDLINLGGTLVFGGETPTLGTELWKSDGTPGGTVLVADISPGSTHSTPIGLTNVNGTVFFAAHQGNPTGRELWKSDGTGGGTMLVKDITPGTDSTDFGSYPNYPNFCAAGDMLFFVADNGVSGRELWRSDGTAGGTVMLKDINPGAGSGLSFSSKLVTFALVRNMISFNGALYFQANDGVNGAELWKSDGTTAGTVLVKDIGVGSGSSNPDDFVVMDGTLFFSATDFTHGYELWKSDGTTAGTVMVKDINPGSAPSRAGWLTDIGGTLFFQAADATHGLELWKSDGTESGTVLVKDISSGAGSSYPGKPANGNGMAFFSADDGFNGDEFWMSDGTEAGTQLVEDIFPGATSSYSSRYVVAGNTLFFTADDPTSGREPRAFALPPPDPVSASSDNSKNSGSSGDPIDTFTGELYDTEAPDLSLGGPMPLFFQRYYASNLRKSFILGDLGSNWLHNFDARLLVTGNTAIYISATGRVTKFLGSGPPMVWTQLTNLDTPYQVSTGGGQDAVLYDPTTDRVYTFDYTTSSLQAGKLVKVEDGHGHEHTVSYDPVSGQIDTVDDGLGRELTFTYNAAVLPKIETVSDGTRAVIYEYTDPIDTEYLTRITDSRGGITVYSYEDTSGVADHALLLTKQRPELNIPFTHTWYDVTTPAASGRVETQTDGDGNPTTFAYDPQGTRETTITDALGNSSVHTHTGSGELSELQDEQGLNVFVSNNTSGQRTGLTDRNGDGTTYTYHPESGKLASVTNAEGNTTTFTYAARAFGDVTLYDLTGIEHADGTTESFDYDGQGRMESHTDQLGNDATATFHANGRPLTETNRAGGVIVNTYDGAARLETTTSPGGDLTRFDYDAVGRPNLITFPDTTTRAFTYDAQDHPLTTTDENGHTLTFTYDDNGNLETVRNPLLKTTTFAYDDNDRLVAITGPLGHTSSRTWDELGRVGTETDANGHTTSFGFDIRGRLADVTAPEGQVRMFTYDDEGILGTATTPLGHTTAYQSDAMGRVTRLTTPVGRVYRTTHDAMGRVETRTGPLGNTTTLDRDDRGLLIGVHLPKSISTSYGRNALGNITSITDPNGNVWGSTFDNGGRRETDVDPLGNTVRFDYDVRDRTAFVTYPGTMGTLTVGYDDAGNLETALWSDGTTHGFGYDDANRLTGATGVTLAYDDAGRLTSSNGILIAPDAGGRIETMTLAPGKAITYAYDDNDRVTAVTDWVGGTTTITWNDDDRLTGITRPNGVHATLSYDADGHLLGLAEGLLSDIALVRDARGNVTSATRDLPTAPSAAALVSETYAFDAASRLDGATYDELGRMTANGADTYTWNLASHLADFTRGGTAVTCAYDAAGLRLSRTVGGTTRNYVWNAGLGSPAISVEKEGATDLYYYVHLPDGRLLYRVEEATNDRAFYHFDETGNTVFVTDDGGAVVASYAYSPYGRLLASTGTLDNPFTWQGGNGAMTEGDGLYYMRARYYDGTLGRFLSRDAVLSISPMGTNPYQYANANPQRYVDRTGLAPDDASETAEARRRRLDQTVYIVAKGPEAGKMAFVQFLLGMDVADILYDKPQETPYQLQLEDFDPPADDIESVVPELAPIIIDYAGNAIVADKAFLPRRGRETSNVETSMREAVVVKGKLPTLLFADPVSPFGTKGGVYFAPDPEPTAAPHPDAWQPSQYQRELQRFHEFQLEQMFRALFDSMLMPLGLDSRIFDLMVPRKQAADPNRIESIVPELTAIVVIA